MTRRTRPSMHSGTLAVQLRTKLGQQLHKEHKSTHKISGWRRPHLTCTKIRVYGGIAIIGNNQQINDSLKELPDGNSRIQVLELKFNDTSIAIENCYMPCRNSRTGLTDYDEALDTLGEILMKYRETHNIILAGDFNASLTRTPENSHDKKLRQFFKEHNIQHKELHAINTIGKTMHKLTTSFLYLQPQTKEKSKHCTHTLIHYTHSTLQTIRQSQSEYPSTLTKHH